MHRIQRKLLSPLATNVWWLWNGERMGEGSVFCFFGGKRSVFFGECRWSRPASHPRAHPETPVDPENARVRPQDDHIRQGSGSGGLYGLWRG